MPQRPASRQFAHSLNHTLTYSRLSASALTSLPVKDVPLPLHYDFLHFIRILKMSSCWEHFSWWHCPKKLPPLAVPASPPLLPLLFFPALIFNYPIIYRCVLITRGYTPTNLSWTILCWKCINIPNLWRTRAYPSLVSPTLNVPTTLT